MSISTSRWLLVFREVPGRGIAPRTKPRLAEQGCANHIVKLACTLTGLAVSDPISFIDGRHLHVIGQDDARMLIILTGKGSASQRRGQDSGTQWPREGNRSRHGTSTISSDRPTNSPTDTIPVDRHNPVSQILAPTSTSPSHPRPPSYHRRNADLSCLGHDVHACVWSDRQRRHRLGWRWTQSTSFDSSSPITTVQAARCHSSTSTPLFEDSLHYGMACHGTLPTVASCSLLFHSVGR